jgi:hypothetical protein
VELLVEGGGIFRGRFLMTPAPGARPGMARRLLAVAFADQVGAALASRSRRPALTGASHHRLGGGCGQTGNQTGSVLAVKHMPEVA